MENNDNLVQAINELVQAIKIVELPNLVGKFEDLQKEIHNLNSTLKKISEELNLIQMGP